MQRNRKLSPLACVIALGVVTLASPALAGSGGGGLPWEGPLQQIQESITGPVAGTIALASVATAGMMLAFGGEMNDFTRVALRVTLVLGLLLGVANVVGLFGATGASIGAVEEHTDTNPAIGGGEGVHG